MFFVFLMLFLSFGSLFSETIQEEPRKVDRYYSEKNLLRLNTINKDLEKLSSEAKATNILEKEVKFRQKHAPLIIAVDFALEHSRLDPVKALLHDAIISSMAPLLLVNANLLKGLIESGLPPIFFEKGAQRYTLFHVAGTQLYLLIPAWFEKFYKKDYGFQRVHLAKISFDKLSIVNSCTSVISALEDKDFEKRYVKDIEKLFSRKNDQVHMPLWDIWLIGHGNVGTDIAGFKRENFLKVLHYFSKNIDVSIALIESCYVGGENSAWLNEAIEKMGRLSFHLIMGSIGNAPITLNFNPNLELGMAPLLVDVYMKVVENYFNDAAFFVKEDSSTFEKFVLKHLVSSLFDKDDAEKGSLHRSENIPQFKAKNSAAFAHLKEIPGFFIVDKKNKDREIHASSDVHTLVLQKPSLESVRLNAIAILKNKNYYNTIDQYIRSIPETKKDTVMMYQALVVSDALPFCKIKKVALEKNNENIGILRFFHGFLTNKIDSFPLLKIKTLQGYNDFSGINNNNGVRDFFNQVMDDEHQLTFNNVKIIKDGTVLLVVADIKDRQYAFFFDFDIDKTMHDGYHTFSLFNDAITMNNIDLMLFLRKHAVYTSKKNPEIYKHLEDLLLGDEFLTSLKKENIKSIDPFIQNNTSFDVAVPRRFIEKGQFYWNIPFYEVIKANLIDALKDIVEVKGVSQELIQNGLLYVKSKEALEVLLHAGGKLEGVNQQTGMTYGQMLLFQCISFEKEKAADLIAFLIESGVDINSKNNFDETILFVARNNSDLLKILLENGANPNESNSQGFTVMYSFAFVDASFKKQLQVLLHAGGVIDEKTIQAFLQNNQYPSPILELFVQYAPQQVLMQFQGNQWVVAAWQNSLKMADTLARNIQSGKTELVKKVLESNNYGTDINMRNSSGNTLLHEAVLSGQVDIIRYLFSQDVKRSVLNAYGQTPLQIAVSQGNQEIIDLF